MLSISALQNVAPQNSKLNSLIGQTQAFMFKTREQLFLRCFGQSRGIPHGKTSAYQAGLEAKAVFLWAISDAHILIHCHCLPSAGWTIPSRIRYKAEINLHELFTKGLQCPCWKCSLRKSAKQKRTKSPNAVKTLKSKVTLTVSLFCLILNFVMGRNCATLLKILNLMWKWKQRFAFLLCLLHGLKYEP